MTACPDPINAKAGAGCGHRRGGGHEMPPPAPAPKSLAALRRELGRGGGVGFLARLGQLAQAQTQFDLRGGGHENARHKKAGLPRLWWSVQRTR